MTQEEFFGRYLIDYQRDRLGSGAFGTVYKAYDSVNNVWRAVKISEVKFIDGKKYSLINEFDLIKKISEHKNIANYLNAYQYNTQTGLHDFVIMQFYEEGNLKQLVDTHTLTLEQKEVILRGILEGINCLHTYKIIHRDLKPSNILIVRDIYDQFVPKISDFGLSRQVAVDDSQITSSISGGTLEYSSPEQLFGSDLKPNTDLWSFGVIAYELLSGKKFFDVPTTNLSQDARRNLIFKKIGQEEKPNLDGLAPSPFKEIIALCLNYDNTKRVQTADELLQILNREASSIQRSINKEEKIAFDSAMQTGEIIQLESFLKDYPNSIYNRLIREKISVNSGTGDNQDGDKTIIISGAEEKKPFDHIDDEVKTVVISVDERQFLTARKAHSIVAYSVYLEQFPKGSYIDDAKAQIKILQKSSSKKLAFWAAGVLGLLLVGVFAFYNYFKKPSPVDGSQIYSQNNLFGYLSLTGDTLTAPIFTKAGPFESGIAKAYKGDTLYEVNTAGNFKIIINNDAQSQTLKLTADQINNADLNTLYQLRNQFSSHSLINYLQDRIKKLESQSEDLSYQKVKTSSNIADIESFISSYPKSKYVAELKKKIADLAKNVSNKSEKDFFEIAKSTNSKTLLESYLEKYPNGIYKVEVNILLNAIFVIESKEAWDDAKATNSIEKVLEYIKQYPTSTYIPAANSTLNNLQKDKKAQAEKQQWEAAKKSNNITQINIFITNNPKSEFVNEAKKTINELENQANKAVPEKKNEVPEDGQCKIITGLFGNDFKRIPAGTYTSSNQSVKSIPSLNIGIHEVTQEQYNTVMNGTNNAYFKDDKNLPIENISFGDIKVFLERLNALSCNAYTYRLPTTEEWEYAALGGDATQQYSGSDDVDAIAVYGRKKIGTQRIGSKKANGFGLYDMSGNVAEFCNDQSTIVRKGGSWYDNKNKLEIRNNITVPGSYKDKMTGFRLVRVSK
ncbi:MAG: protein kinase [Saprospiraceae bacterium]|nr:protein kinase [Candidatus Brachybacter algidus]MBK8749765.1 protein kinase [Candidatus Brachybacter algidus]